LGILIITAFSYIMSFGQSLASQQQVKMESFRRAMQKAYKRNAGVSNTLKKYASAASVNSGFMQGQGLTPESSYSVTWQKGKPGDQGSLRQSSFAFYRVNDVDIWAVNDTDDAMSGDMSEYGLPLDAQTTYSADGSPSDYEMLLPASVYKDNYTRTEDYSFSEQKNESGGGISYSRTANLNDSASGEVYMHWNTNQDTDPGDDTPVTASYTDAGTESYSTSVSYSDPNGNWSTPQ
jgi:hypothetical protein